MIPFLVSIKPSPEFFITITRVNKANIKVSITAICDIILFCRFMPLVKDNNTNPKTAGIKAVY